MDIIVLSRLNLIPGIDEDTPIVVLEEISRCHDVPLLLTLNIAVFLSNVQDHPIGSIHDPVRPGEWDIVARYVNPTQQWTIPELQTAYDVLKERALDGGFFPPNNFTFGLQTPLDPARLNACVLYSICRNYGIQVQRTTTLYQLATLCQMLVRPEAYARTIVYNTISHVPRNGLMQLYITASQLIDDIPDPIEYVLREASNYDALEESIATFCSKDSLRMRVQPRTYPDAIVLAAMNFKIDISGAVDPIREYSLLFQNPDNYIPNDPALRSLVIFNPHIIRLTEYFNPLLPIDLYDEQVLERMAIREGYTRAALRLDSAYTLLQTAYMSYTFYHGRQPGIRNTRTPFLYEDVQDLNNDLIICFGVQGAHGTMTAFRYNELWSLFKERRNFINPMADDNDTFPPISIVKLKNLCKMIRNGDTPDIIDERNELYDAIINTELFTDVNQSKARELFETHEQSEPDIQDRICTVIEKLLHLSMYMRGWLGHGAYPIERAPVDNQAIIDINVTNAVCEFETLCTELGEIGQLILNLPLLKYRAEDFFPITAEERGRTIAERLFIVKAGDDHENYDSCIRLSSNLFAVTAYRYMVVLGMQAPFRIDKLRDIS